MGGKQKCFIHYYYLINMKEVLKKCIIKIVHYAFNSLSKLILNQVTHTYKQKEKKKRTNGVSIPLAHLSEILHIFPKYANTVKL